MVISAIYFSNKVISEIIGNKGSNQDRGNVKNDM